MGSRRGGAKRTRRNWNWNGNGNVLMMLRGVGGYIRGCVTSFKAEEKGRKEGGGTRGSSPRAPNLISEEARVAEALAYHQRPNNWPSLYTSHHRPTFVHYNNIIL